MTLYDVMDVSLTEVGSRGGTTLGTAVVGAAVMGAAMVMVGAAVVGAAVMGAAMVMVGAAVGADTRFGKIFTVRFLRKFPASGITHL